MFQTMTATDIASYFGCSYKTITRILKLYYSKDYRTFRQKSKYGNYKNKPSDLEELNK